MIKGTEIRQQLRNQTLEDLLISSINTVGDRIYPDDMAVLDMEALTQIVDSWRSTHAITYGQVLPNTGVIAEGISDGGGLEPLDNQVIDIIAISLANSGGAPVEVTVSLGDLPIAQGVAVPPTGLPSGELVNSGLQFPLTLSRPLAIKFTVTNGTSSDFSAKIAYQYRTV